MSCNDSCAVEKAEAKEFAYFSGLTKGAENERRRIINLIKSYWCGDRDCTKHATDWPQFIMEITGEIK